MGGGTDGSCYQIVFTFAATTERLRAWIDSGSGASSGVILQSQVAPDRIRIPRAFPDLIPHWSRVHRISPMRQARRSSLAVSPMRRQGIRQTRR